MARLTLFTLSLVSLAASAQLSTSSDFRVVKSKYLSSNQVRVKSHEPGTVCDGGIRSHTGWADVGEHHMFFWYYEARKPENDTPVMVWFTGGPGGSSQAGAFAENGDCLFDTDSNSTQRNQFGWTEAFHSIYLDQPAGVGLSYIDDAGTNSSYPSTVDEAALDVVAFLRLFAEAFPSLARNPVHLIGESYAGRFVPAFGDTVLKYNELVGETNPEDAIPLASLVSISAWTRPAVQIPSLYDAACYPLGPYSASLNESVCSEMADAVPKCEMLLEACDSTRDPLICARGGGYCDEVLTGVIGSQHVNKYDRRMWCDVVGQCYPVMKGLTAWMNRKEIFEDLLDVPTQTGGLKKRFDFQSQLISDRFHQSGDFWMDSSHYVLSILNSRGKVPMLFTAGDADVLVNPKGVRQTLESMKWYGNPRFRNALWEQLPGETKDGNSAGRLKKADGLWYAEIAEAGHLSPRDQPEVWLEILKHWLMQASYKDAEKEGPLDGKTAQYVLGLDDL